MRHPVLPAFMALLVSVCSRAQDPLSAGEVLILLEAGVAPGEVEQTLDRRGGPALITEAELADAARLHCGERLLRRLERAVEILRRFNRLAQDFEVWRDPGRVVEMLVPRGWSVAATPSRNRLFVTVESPLSRSDLWFQAPRIFLALETGSAFPCQAEGEIAARVMRLFQDRIEGLGLSPREVVAGAGQLGDRAAPHHEMTATDPAKSFTGVIGIRTRVFPDGSIATLGFTCAKETAAAVRALFEETVASLVAGEVPARADMR